MTHQIRRLLSHRHPYLISRLSVFVSLMLWAVLSASPAHASDTVTDIHLPLVADSGTDLTPALDAALGGLSHPDGSVPEIETVRISGRYAVAFANVSNKQVNQEIILLARYDDLTSWQITTSQDAPALFNASLDQMPPDLLDAGDKAFLRRYESQTRSPESRNAAVFSQHNLPWPGGQIGYVMQKDGGGHERQIDFDIQGNAASGQVLASKPGVVAFVKQSSASGCPSMVCWQQSNMVVVQHGPAEYSWYVHLVPNSVPVRVGDRVDYGSVLGIEGETGYASGVHLHYMTSRGHTAWTPPGDPNRAPWALTIERVDFRESSWASLNVGQRYTSLNGTGNTCTEMPLAADQVALYEHANYCGLYTVLDPGDYPTPGAFRFYNDRTSSLRLGSDAAVVLCQDEAYGGKCETFAADVSDLTNTTVGNDQVSSLKVASRGELTTPETPQLLEPATASLITSTAVSLVWMPAAKAVSYQVQVAAATDGFSSPASEVVTESTQITLHTLPEATYHWRVRATGIGGILSEWSQPRTFTLDAAPYRHPYPQSPDDGAAISESSVQLTWIDTETVKRHRLHIYAGEQSSSGAIGESSLVVSTTVTDTVHTTEPLADGVYSWRVCRINARGAAVRCSDFRTFEIDTAPPAPPVLASYADGAEISDDTPTFAWQPVRDAVDYNVQVYWVRTNKSNAKPVQGRTLGPLVSAVTQETSYTTRSLADGAYGWRVRAGDAAGNWSDWSQPRSVTITAPPDWLTFLPIMAAK